MGARSKLATTELSAPRATWQLPVPEQPPPDQPAKTAPGSGVALKVTTEPTSNQCRQLTPQTIPAGALLIDPDPPPPRAIVSRRGRGAGPRTFSSKLPSLPAAPATAIR